MGVVWIQFSLASVGVGTAYGTIDSYSVSGGAAPVPALSGLGIVALMGSLMLAARLSFVAPIRRDC
jgi:hypothetical protein